MAIRRGQIRCMALAIPLPATDAIAARARVERLEQLLEGLFHVPVLGRVGLDALVGLIPGVGDATTALMGLYLVWEARNLGASRTLLARMVGNVAIDAVIGSVPIAGDLLDVVFRSNTRNLKLLRRHLNRGAA